MSDRPTMEQMRETRDGPRPSINKTEQCRSCADAKGAVEFASGKVAVFCSIPRDRARLYPMLRAIMVPEDAIMPCWRGAAT